MRLLVFLQGTVTMHRTALGLTRAERVEQSRAGTDPSLLDLVNYVPIGNAVGKLRCWSAQGAQIDYLTSHRDPHELTHDKGVLVRHGFPCGRILSRGPGQSYGDVVEQQMPDVLIEDDCESIGACEISYFQVPAELRRRIRSIIVPEFGGIDHLSDSVANLADSARSCGPGKGVGTRPAP